MVRTHIKINSEHTINDIQYPIEFQFEFILNNAKSEIQMND